MSIEDKICLPQDLARRLVTLRRPMVMTNGVFDLLHRGHVNYLHQAAELGGSLVVAVNSDVSARLLAKGPERPLNAANDRAYVLAGLASVSLVTFFDARTPVELIKTVRPDIYVKGGDYDMETLEETRVVRSWGGESVAIPFVDGFSTSTLVQRIRQPQQQLTTYRKAAFLDRDGVINRDDGYVYRWEDFKFMPGAIEGMRLLMEAGYAIVIVTNQSGLARGYYSREQYQQLNVAIQQYLEDHGVKLAGVYHCPHHPDGVVPALSIDCQCRKPAPGMILQAASELAINLKASLLIGDKSSDIKAAIAAGIGSSYLVKSNNQVRPASLPTNIRCFVSLLDCAKYLVNK
jgi:rfaE bifunctional protein nucleotidyltransferase chain/domain